MPKIIDLVIPNIGDFKNVEIIEVLITENQNIKKNDGIITLESDKSSVEVPSQFSGKIKTIKVNDIALLIEDDDSAYEIPSPISGIVKNIMLKKGQKIKLAIRLQKLLIKL